MKKRTPVSTIMTSDLVTVNPTNSVADVAKIFSDKNIHHVPVVSGTDLIGIISKTDMDRISYVSDWQSDKANTAIYDNLELDQVMTKNVETIQSEDQIKEAAELLAKGRYHALPVVEGGNIKGIVTSTDVINYLLEQF
jgi:CBS domain-containing protein